MFFLKKTDRQQKTLKHMLIIKCYEDYNSSILFLLYTQKIVCEKSILIIHTSLGHIIKTTLKQEI